MSCVLVEMRRQNRSCDQCRKAKRACDLAPLQDTKGKKSSSGDGNNASFAKSHYATHPALTAAELESSALCIGLETELDITRLVDHLLQIVSKDRGVRLYTGVVKFIRRDSSTIVSDLAKTSEDPATPDVPSMSSDMIERAMLPGPWTMILTKAFTKVSVLLLNEVEEIVWGSFKTWDHPLIENLVAQYDSCIKSLRYLGGKSDMARAVSAALSSSPRLHSVLTQVTFAEPGMLVM
ncbi:hypothetical protein EDB81DRAFT_768551 [Dactylonectria macrodidyma]|uniref:Zn(2)-C6 fungal-type domain-containing protein n=1 Tax=Dactylonectria macrodidyma TaxID=307937 RepID=A0A9P9D359_9HYPO|nr:hypothetical protein EDB81DRAFT_768551 [Dactylonectria macrodidyma]